jgi:hypothetical protein
MRIAQIVVRDALDNFILRGTMQDGSARVLLAAGLFATIACDRPMTERNLSPTSPSPIPANAAPAQAAQGATLTGTVWLHSSTGVQPYRNVTVWGWSETALHGHRIGPTTTDDNGRYTFAVASGSLVRVQVAATYQPCVAAVEITGNTTRDAHVINDATQLGANLPADLAADRPGLSGQVFEVVADGTHRPVAGARVELDMIWGMGDVSATTLTDADGRYVFCGLGGHQTTYVYASKGGYQLADVGTVSLSGDTTRDIEIKK